MKAEKLVEVKKATRHPDGRVDVIVKVPCLQIKAERKEAGNAKSVH